MSTLPAAPITYVNGISIWVFFGVLCVISWFQKKAGTTKQHETTRKTKMNFATLGYRALFMPADKPIQDALIL